MLFQGQTVGDPAMKQRYSQYDSEEIHEQTLWAGCCHKYMECEIDYEVRDANLESLWTLYPFRCFPGEQGRGYTADR